MSDLCFLRRRGSPPYGKRGYEVVVGKRMDGTGHTSALAKHRAAELMAMLTDPSIRAIVPAETFWSVGTGRRPGRHELPR